MVLNIFTGKRTLTEYLKCMRVEFGLIFLVYRYGYVTPEDVPELLEQHIAKGEVVERLLRFVLF